MVTSLVMDYPFIPIRVSGADLLYTIHLDARPLR